MSQAIAVSPTRYGAVLRALEGFRNLHAMSVLLGGFLLVALVSGLGMASGSAGLMALLGFVAVLLGICVVHAAGIALMDDARAQPQRGFTALLMAGAMCFLRFIGIAIVAALGFAAYMLALAILLYVCKIPFLGPLLLVVLLPLMILLTAALMAVLLVGLSLVAPALWEGNSITGAFSRLAAVASQRPLEVMVSLILLSLLTGVVMFIVGGFIFAGTAEVGGLAAAVLGGKLLGGMPFMGAIGGMGGGYGSGMAYGGAMGYGAGDSGSGLAVAGMVGLMIVWALVWGAIASLQMNGLCHIYLQACAGTDDAHARENLDKSLSQAKEMFSKAGARMAGAARDISAKVEGMSKSAGAAASQTEAGAQPAPPAEPEAAPTRTCPSCKAVAGPEDQFCGECGARLEAG
jgi:hypothetical protein